MRNFRRSTAAILGISLLVGHGMALADSTPEVAARQADASAIEKSDIKRGMVVQMPSAAMKDKNRNQRDNAAKRAGDPIPGIDITMNQGHSVCQGGSDDCNDGDAPVDLDAVQKSGARFKAGKALAETVKNVDNGRDVKHLDADSDDDGLPDQ